MFNREDLDKIIGRVQNQIIEKVLCSIPDMIVHLARRTDMMQSLYRDLFIALPEAKDDKELLAKVIEKVELQNPGKSPQEIFALIPAAYTLTKAAEGSITSVDMSKLNETVNGVI